MILVYTIGRAYCLLWLTCQNSSRIILSIIWNWDPLSEAELLLVLIAHFVVGWPLIPCRHEIGTHCRWCFHVVDIFLMCKFDPRFWSEERDSKGVFLQDFETSIGFYRFPKPRTTDSFSQLWSPTPQLYSRVLKASTMNYTWSWIYSIQCIHIYIYIAEESCRKLDPQNRQVGLQLW